MRSNFIHGAGLLFSLKREEEEEEEGTESALFRFEWDVTSSWNGLQSVGRIQARVRNNITSSAR